MKQGQRRGGLEGKGRRKRKKALYPHLRRRNMEGLPVFMSYLGALPEAFPHPVLEKPQVIPGPWLLRALVPMTTILVKISLSS